MALAARRLRCVYKIPRLEPLYAEVLRQKMLAEMSVCNIKVLCASGRGYTPFDAPESISELALRPLIPRLFLLCPFPPRPSLISLFLLMTGVSATGKAIFDEAP